ncbi:hypothetical protein ZIOFF_038699 [Zingiber officinale]|uniref:Uncharacterized protein n=1 Tax=Zingiber officinale TaxID=94328 RepID=A0A8J5G3H9_ZINOF|nr:hypothetical protein ZIOFF_038699 [Zingiber officinale]
MAKLSDLQTDLVQLGAALNDDHALADEYPVRLAELMTVADGARYVRNAFKGFLEECERCQKEAVDGSIGRWRRGRGRRRPSSGKCSLACLACNTSHD